MHLRTIASATLSSISIHRALRACVLAALAVAASGSAAFGGEPAPRELELAQAWSVEGPGNFQPSGLALDHGTLVTVSDKHSRQIFRIDLRGGIARCRPAVTFTGPKPLPAKGWLDLEAVVIAPDGGYFLASEEAARVLRVPAGGGGARWVTPDLRAAGAASGLFAQHNAGCEGLALLGPDDLLVAAEREPRGLLEMTGLAPAPQQFKAQLLESSRFSIPAGRRFDVADLCVWRGRVFALARNQHLVVELVRDASGAWAERGGDAAWSFSETENAPAYRFIDRRWGIAEGLAIDDDAIFVVLDNNGDPREASRRDRRPWLFRFRNAIPR